MLNRAYAIEQIAAIELNLACPNIPGKPVTAYDFEELDKVLRQVTSLPLFGKKPIGVKLAPYFDMPEFDRAATVLAKYPINYIVTINSLCNALCIDVENESVAMKAKDGFGGLGGGFIKPTALANIRQLYNRLAEKGRSDIDLVAVGGCASGRDAFEFILCGAKAVQVGTCHWNEGPGCFDRIATELEDIMRSKGYTSIEEFRGKLKPYVEPKAPLTAPSTSASDSWLRSPQAAGGTVRRSFVRAVASPQEYTMPLLVAGLACTVAYLLATRR
jgi:dihydroorotate dehydrogenase (fumarate)